MRKLISLLFISLLSLTSLIASAQAKPKSCQLNDEIKAKLMAMVPYSVDKITINDCVYTWHISNKKYNQIFYSQAGKGTIQNQTYIWFTSLYKYKQPAIAQDSVKLTCNTYFIH